MTNRQKIGLYVVVGFIGFYILKNPTEAAETVNSVVGGILWAFGQLSTFVEAL